MTTVLITGGIGSGKSLVCRMLEARGVPVYDFDGRTKELYDSDPELLSRIIEVMRPHLDSSDVCPHGAHDAPDASGGNLLNRQGRLDRRVLASVVFGSPRALADLEKVVHPAVLQDFEKWRESQSSPVVAAESAIVLDRPLFRGLFDKVVLVDAPVSLRLRRAAFRDGVTEENVRQRMLSQTLMNSVSDGLVIPDADYVIVNDKSEAELSAEMNNVLLEILKQDEDRS